MSHDESVATQFGNNVRVITDAHGREWTCWEEGSAGPELHERGCEPVDEVVYDRGFGG